MHKSFLFFILFLFFNVSNASESVVDVKVDTSNNVSEIKFSTKEELKFAIFSRDNKLWFVIDKAVKLNFEDNIESSLLQSFQSFDTKNNYTAGYFIIQNHHDTEISLTKNDGVWLIKITPYDSALLPSELGARRMTKTIAHNRNAVQITTHAAAKNIISFIDPELGDELLIVPEELPTRTKKSSFVDFEILESLSGIAISKQNDSLEVVLQGDAIEIFSKTYLNISNAKIEKANKTGFFEDFIKDDNDAILDIRSYNIHPKEFNRTLNAITQSINNNYDASLKGEEFLSLSIFFLANQWYLESKGVLEVVHYYSNIIDNSYQMKLISAVIYFMANDFYIANEIMQSIDLNSVELKNRAEVRFWQNICTIAYSQMSQEKVDSDLIGVLIKRSIKSIIDSNNNFLKQYEDHIFLKICFKVAEVSLKLNNIDNLKPLIKVLSLKDLNDNDADLLRYYYGKALVYDGNNKEAINQFKNCSSNTLNQRVHAYCQFEELNLQFQEKEINIIEYINALQKLSVSWRGDDLEIQVLETLAKTYYEASEMQDAIRIWKMISLNYPNSLSSFAAATKAGKAFLQYFKTTDDSKLAKLAFFYEFQDLIPLGDDGDDIIIQTASYMLDLDLIDQATRVMEYQVKNRLFGIRREKTLNELIKVFCSVDNWNMAEKTVESFTQLPFNMTNPIIVERKYLYINAVIEIGEYYDAIAMLYGDNSLEADELRAKAFFKLENWEEFSDNSEPYLYSIRNNKDHHLTEDDYSKILRQSIAYFSNNQMSLLTNLFLDFKPKFKKGSRSGERVKLFYRIAEELKTSQGSKESLKNLIQQLAAI